MKTHLQILMRAGIAALLITASADAGTPAYFVKKATWFETMRSSVAELCKQARANGAVKLGAWYGAGPFRSDHPFADVLPPEINPALDQTYNNGSLRWRKHEEWKDDGVCSLDPVDTSATFLFRTLSVARDTTVRVYLGSDDGIKVWLNTRLVLAHDADRGCEASQETLMLSLAKGENAFMMKINNGTAEHAFYFSLTGLDRTEIWQHLMREFKADNDMQEMAWEKLDGIWTDYLRTGNLTDLMRSYRKAYAASCLRLGSLPSPAADTGRSWLALGSLRRQYLKSRHEELKRIASDPQRPVYHFLPPRGWMNDPNGLSQFNGEYHLFYQHYPYAGYPGTMAWGHASSPDLVHWKHLPIAIRTGSTYDKDGVWTGCMVNDNGVPTAIYTGVHPQVQVIATSKDMITWEKPAGNPVIPQPPANLTVTGFRDPCVWKDGDTWYMVVGSGIQGTGGMILLYRSADLKHWEYVHPAFVGDTVKTAPMWECPNFFPLQDKWVLIVSTDGHAIYWVGDFKNLRFTPEYRGTVDEGGSLYAPQLFQDARGRRIMFGWLWENRSVTSQIAAGWAGVQSLPRVLSLDKNNHLLFEPVPETQLLRGSHAEFRNFALAAGQNTELPDFRSDAFELNAKIDLKNANQACLSVRRSATGVEETRIVYDREAATLSIDRRQSSLDQSTDKAPHAVSLDLPDGELLQLHVFVDHSVVEVYAGNGVCLTARVYPTRSDCLGVAFLAGDGDAAVVSCDVWQLKPIGR